MALRSATGGGQVGSAAGGEIGSVTGTYGDGGERGTVGGPLGAGGGIFRVKGEAK